METKEKWYNIPEMVGALLLFWPPLGIYGVYKSEMINQKWKNATYIALALVLIVFIYFLLD